MKSTINLLCVVLLLFCTISITPGFTSEDVFTLQSMCRKSSDIVEAEVISITSFSPDNGRNQIFTSIKLQVENSLKGLKEKNNIVEIITYGGSLNGTTITLSGAPSFIKGEKVVVFLKEWTSKNYGTNYMVYGRAQGKFRIVDTKVSRDSDVPLRRYKNGTILNAHDGNTMDYASLISEINSISK